MQKWAAAAAENLQGSWQGLCRRAGWRLTTTASRRGAPGAAAEGGAEEQVVFSGQGAVCGWVGASLCEWVNRAAQIEARGGLWGGWGAYDCIMKDSPHVGDGRGAHTP